MHRCRTVDTTPGKWPVRPGVAKLASVNRFIATTVCLSFIISGGGLWSACGETGTSGASETAPSKGKPASDAQNAAADAAKDASERAAPPTRQGARPFHGGRDAITSLLADVLPLWGLLE